MKREALALSTAIMLALPACGAESDPHEEPVTEPTSTIPAEAFKPVTEDQAYELWGEALHEFAEEFDDGEAALGVGRGVCMYWQNGTGYTVVKNPVVYSMHTSGGTMNFFPFFVPDDEGRIAIKNGPFDFYGVDASGKQDSSHSWGMDHLYAFTDDVTFDTEEGFGDIGASDDMQRAWLKGPDGERLAETLLVSLVELDQVLEDECSFVSAAQDATADKKA